MLSIEGEVSISVVDEIADQLQQTGPRKPVKRITVSGGIPDIRERWFALAGEKINDGAATAPDQRDFGVGQTVMFRHVAKEVSETRVSISFSYFGCVPIRQSQFQGRYGDQLTGLDEIEINAGENVQLLGALKLRRDDDGDTGAQAEA